MVNLISCKSDCVNGLLYRRSICSHWDMPLFRLLCRVYRLVNFDTPTNDALLLFCFAAPLEKTRESVGRNGAKEKNRKRGRIPDSVERKNDATCLRYNHLYYLVSEAIFSNRKWLLRRRSAGCEGGRLEVLFHIRDAFSTSTQLQVSFK